MTKLKTIITALLIGTSSMATVAAAQPSSTVYEVGARDHRTTDNTIAGVNVDARFDARFGWNDGREIDPGYARRYPAPRPVYSVPTPGIACGPDGQPWAVVSDSVPANGDRQFINFVDSVPGGLRASALRLQLTRGSVYVYAIGVEFMNGRTTGIHPNAWMSARDGATAMVDLGGLKNVRRVVVYTAPGAHASYQLLGA